MILNKGSNNNIGHRIGLQKSNTEVLDNGNKSGTTKSMFNFFNVKLQIHFNQSPSNIIKPGFSLPVLHKKS